MLMFETKGDGEGDEDTKSARNRAIYYHRLMMVMRVKHMNAQCRDDGPTLYPEDVFAVLLLPPAAADRRGLVVIGRGGRVHHGDDGHGEVDPQHVGERHSQGAHDHERVPGAEAH